MQPFFARIFMFVLIILLPAVMSAHLSHLWTAIERQLDHKCNNIREIRIVEVVTVYMANEHGQVSAEVEFFLFFFGIPPSCCAIFNSLKQPPKSVGVARFSFYFFLWQLVKFFFCPEIMLFYGRWRPVQSSMCLIHNFLIVAGFSCFGLFFLCHLVG